MKSSEYKNIFMNEKSHFYYMGTHKLILDSIKKYRKLFHSKKLTILDAGCGTGLLVKKMSRLGLSKGIDISPQAVKYAKSRGIEVSTASVSNLPFKQNSFDIVTSIDVLYHKGVKSDIQALKESARVTKNNGLIILKLPAYNWIKRTHDKVVSTKKRYTVKEVKSILAKAGYTPIKVTYLTSYLLPFAIFEKLFKLKIIKGDQYGSDVDRLPKILNNIFYFVFCSETFLLRYFNLPFGLSIFAIARKK